MPFLGSRLQGRFGVLVSSVGRLDMEVQLVQVLGSAAQGNVREAVLGVGQQRGHELLAVGFFHNGLIEPGLAEDVQSPHPGDGLQTHRGAAEPLDPAVGCLGGLAVTGDTERPADDVGGSPHQRAVVHRTGHL